MMSKKIMEGKEEKFDIAVVGGGPAGLSAAYSAANRTLHKDKRCNLDF
jgi:succinate dehydrogenase/fumarate reductase flavoprotein subunit